MPLNINSDQQATFGEREVENLLAAWGKANTPANRGLLSAEAKKFRDEPAWAPHTWERFYQYGDELRVKRLLADKYKPAASGTVVGDDAEGDHAFTVIEGWAPPKPKMKAPSRPQFTPAPPPPPKQPGPFIFEPKQTVPPPPKQEPAPPPQKPAAVFFEPKPTPPPETEPAPFKPEAPITLAETKEEPTREYTQAAATPPRAPEEPLKPKRLALVLILLGLVAAATLVFFLFFFRPITESTVTTTSVPAVTTPEPEPTGAVAVALFTSAVRDNSPVMFVANEETFLPGEEGKLDNILAAMKGLSKVDLTATGHTADNNMPKAQWLLSVARAKAVKDYLFRNPPSAELKIEVDGKGATEPVITGVPPGRQEKNRRVEIEVKSAE